MERKLWETEEVVFGIASLFLCADLGPWLFLKVRREGWSAAFKVRPVRGAGGGGLAAPSRDSLNRYSSTGGGPRSTL